MRKSLSVLRSELSRRLARPDWPVKRRECFESHGWKCGVCDLDYRGNPGVWLECNHVHYDTLGDEDPTRDLVPLCSVHHLKGTMTRERIRQYRSAYLFRKRTRSLFVWLYRQVKKLAGLALPATR